MVPIGLNSTFASDGTLCGVCRHLIIQPQTLRLTNLVIYAHHNERIVPASMINSVSEKGIQLDGDLAELAKLNPFTETHYAEMEMTDNGLSEYSYLYPLSGTQTWLSVPFVSYNIAAGEFIINRQTQVEAKNGHVGQFKALVVDEETGHISQLVFQKGHLWERKQNTIPASVIDRFEGDTIYLNILKSAL